MACYLSGWSAAPISQRSWVQIPYKPEFFSGLIFTTAHVMFTTAKIAIKFTSLFALYDFQIFPVVYSPLHGFMWYQDNDQLPSDLFAQLVELCIGLAEVMDSNRVQA